MRQRNKKSNKLHKRNQIGESRNLMVLKLLTHVPEFKKDVISTRREMGIDADGFIWRGEDIFKWARVNNINNYINDGEEIEKEYTFDNEYRFRMKFPSDIFEKKMSILGAKYRLPFNMYAFPYSGLPRYILSNQIMVSNKNYGFGLTMVRDRYFHFDVVVYSPLNKEEGRDLLSEMADIYKNTLPMMVKGFDQLASKIYRKNINRDLALFDEQISRKGKPQKIKKYVEDSYMDIAMKSGGISDKKMKQIEKINKQDVVVEFNNLTSKQIGKRHGASADVARQVKKRLNSLAKDLFTYGLEL